MAKNAILSEMYGTDAAGITEEDGVWTDPHGILSIG